MRFALFCDDPLVSAVVEALKLNVGGHQLSHVVSLTGKSANFPYGSHGFQFVEHWEDLLTAKDVDAVLIGGSDSLILEGAKQLATAGIPILFAPQAAQDSTFVYELSLIHDDNHVLLYPLFLHRFDSAVKELRLAITGGKLGRIQFLQLNRSLKRPSSNTPISQAEVDAELLPDADLLRWLIGDYNQVTCLQTAATSEGVLMQSVVLAGRSLPEANWSIKPVDGLDEWRLTVRGDQNVADLYRVGPSLRWVCEIDGRRIEGDEQNTARGLIEAFAAARSNEKSVHVASSDEDRAEWSELVKCFETLDAMHRSVRRKRTIELHFEPMSERAIFKTQMTAIGCGLLVATFLLTLCYLGIASIVPLPSGVLIGLRTLVFAPLVIFLMAQILLPLTRPSSNERTLPR